ncbi:MAG: prepilin-type N-terminal cleavage/methylation domain-containing protein [Candidatus Brocadia sp. AMX2]|uniref:Prepilin-type N-terminal cleavage/methylation domain-containing protein n=1 Tax=Candidatus Brocadia sinica JPN1 TaxID=1197129 RepID=A0ABQ0JSG5_9BACT|nr:MULTISPECIES: prepilin-type N-terminal cleavage/methylation domain-containing protein [Brocadia]KXK28174.1 MAG: hypothetical protein UZ01_02812 [Candidatus Brocadia sinica]MBC6931316.1 prepilin-type N-terminal cleavage/methylation domain-containing protein [Candidatus Brocadia sp.]MBL1168663.1 prepilin-type N-terminal cleavage/methylation domain-containing protein [Candidatus Brocadia sp. AMX1]NOG43263.1 prepilin-type N-terminal cleavage/methylation domain-containing protein [Planctomycetota
MPYLSKNNESGFSIIELMVSLAITLILMVVAIKMFTIQRVAYNSQEQITDLQQNIRSSMDVVSREIRMAGYMVVGTTTIRTAGTSTITFLGDIDSDIVADLVINAGAGTTTLFVSVTPDNDYEIESTDCIYISDGLHSELIPVNSSAPHFIGEPDPIYLKTGLLYSYPAGSTTVRSVERVTFSLDTTNKRIDRNTQPLAENIEVMRFTYGTNIQTGATNTVNIAIAGRTMNKFLNYPGDGYRRGTLTSTIQVRNE